MIDKNKNAPIQKEINQLCSGWLNVYPRNPQMTLKNNCKDDFYLGAIK